jgi:LmbE family N-acetylglucosaminyl deacetylase
MSASLASGRAALALAGATAGAWFLEPTASPAGPAEAAAPPAGWPVVCVAGLAPLCGATTVAWALAVALAGLHPGVVAMVTAAPGRSRPGHRGAAQLARTVTSSAGVPARPVGRLAAVSASDLVPLAEAARRLAPLVFDVGSGSRSLRAAAAASDHVVLVAGPATEPALPAVVARSLARDGVEPWCVVSRGSEQAWSGRGALVVRHSRAGTRLARSGRDPRGRLGSALERLSAQFRPLDREPAAAPGQ